MNRQDQFIPHLIVRDGLAALEFYKTVARRKVIVLTANLVELDSYRPARSCG